LHDGGHAEIESCLGLYLDLLDLTHNTVNFALGRDRERLAELSRTRALRQGHYQHSDKGAGRTKPKECRFRFHVRRVRVSVMYVGADTKTFQSRLSRFCCKLIAFALNKVPDGEPRTSPTASAALS
jgi:hypothetical protein